ncbi:MAG: GGDEF domain-containing protein [Betaproteobacteria bacterium]|nr:GGDEF domain-containing protein [Betaproteobacteria bacterium]
MASQERWQAWQARVLTVFHLSPTAAVWAGVALCAAIALVDIVTPPELNLSLFYVFVILLATWNAGLRAGFAFAAFACGMQWVVMSAYTPPYLHSVYWYIALADRCATFFVVLVLTHPLRLLFEDHENAARIDSLTGAANRKYFMELLATELRRSERSGRAFSVALVDCDDFKVINDQFGHLVGDSVLRGVVEIAKESVRATDTVARFGGDEFAILFPETGAVPAHDIARRVQSKIRQSEAVPYWTKTVSIGLGTFTNARGDPTDVVAQCDALMYQAKRLGRGEIAAAQFDGGPPQGGDGARPLTISNIPGRTA